MKNLKNDKYISNDDQIYIVGLWANTKELIFKMQNGDYETEELVGYIYVFNKDDSMVKDEKSYQYKCFKELKPIDVVTVRYGDFSSYYEVLDSEKVLK